MIRAAGFRTPPFSSTDPPGNGGDVFFRHDIDLPECPGRVAAMVAAELRLGITSGVFFQANAHAPYDLRTCRSLAHELAAQGVEIGLHTICYTAPSPWAAFAEERRRFEDALALAPRSFNAHGLGRYMLRQRLAFYREVTPAKLRGLGFAYSDLSPALRRYDYIVEDSHALTDVTAPNAADPFAITSPDRRFMKNDLTSLPPLRRVRYLVLTHPGYWLR